MTVEEFRKIMSKGERVVFHAEVLRKMSEYSDEARKITMEINNSYHTEAELRELFSRLIGEKVADDFRVFPPFYTDCGKNLKLGKNVFINSCCCFQDQGGIEIGDDTFIGHSVVIATLNHDLVPENRGDMFPRPVKIGKRVWIGAHATILPGVTIGDNSVIAAGAVVTRDVSQNVVAGGVPCKKIKDIPQE